MRRSVYYAERNGANASSSGLGPLRHPEAESLRSRPRDSEAAAASGGGAPRESINEHQKTPHADRDRDRRRNHRVRRAARPRVCARRTAGAHRRATHRRARARIRVGPRISRLERWRVRVETRPLGRAAAPARRVGRSALAARPTRMVLHRRSLALRRWMWHNVCLKGKER
jgi:hypothetical protein